MAKSRSSYENVNDMVRVSSTYSIKTRNRIFKQFEWKTLSNIFSSILIHIKKGEAWSAILCIKRSVKMKSHN